MCEHSATRSCAVSWAHCVLTSQACVRLCRESTMRTMQEALQEAEKYASRCEALAARVEEGRGVLEQARAEQAERARAAAEAEAAVEAAATAAAAAMTAERLRMEQEMSALALRMQSDAMRMQQMQAQLGVASPAATEVEEEALCVVCMDARKQHAMMPCMHVCVCEACAQRLLGAQTPPCPVCRTPVEGTTRVFF